LAGQVIEIECTQPELTAHLNLLDDGLELRYGAAAAPNVQLRGSASALFSRMLSVEGNTNVEVNGDETLLIQLLEILRSHRPDPAPLLAKLVGNDPAQTITAAFELGMQTVIEQVNGGIDDAIQNSKNGLQSYFVAQTNAETLQHQLDHLRLRLDRAAARVHNLEQSKTRSTEQ
jgi:ubiquinone biosynthesis protein UbiJ